MNYPRLPAALTLALLLLASPLAADDPAVIPVLKLVAPENVNVGDLATVSVDPASNVQDVQFLIAPACANPLNVKTGIDFVSFVAGADKPKGGHFTVFAAANLNGKTVTADVVVRFTVPEPPPNPGPGPSPPPGPGPPPTPPPAPVATHLWIVTIDDAASRTQQTAATLDDPNFWPKLEGAGHKFRQYDASNPAAADYLKLVPATITGPVVIFVDAALVNGKGRVLEIDPLPASADGLAAIVAKLTGKTIGGAE